MTANQAPNEALTQTPESGAPAGAPRPQARRSSPLILILDDGLQQAVQLQRDLTSANYEVEIVATDADAERRLRDARPDLMVLDFEVRDLSADLARLRAYAEKAGVPIVILVAQDSDGLRGLLTGADDFLTKPVASIHLIARVQSLLRRAKSGHPEPVARSETRPLLRVKDVEIDFASHRVTRAGRTINLSPTEYRILTLFMENPQRLFSREHLREAFWGDRPDTEARSVDVFVSRLRRALNRGFRTSALRTVRGVGYGMR